MAGGRIHGGRFQWGENLVCVAMKSFSFLVLFLVLSGPEALTKRERERIPTLPLKR
jgi:hypothetical protein